MHDAVGSAITFADGIVRQPAAAGPESRQPRSSARTASHAEASVPGLTARERQIAALIARGLSNRGIAAELVISPATAARHVANIFGKLGVTSRAQVAAWTADRQGD